MKPMVILLCLAILASAFVVLRPKPVPLVNEGRGIIIIRYID